MTQPQVLFISPAFFGYEVDICNALQRRGAKVDYFDERPSNDAFVKAILRTSKALVSRGVRAHFEGIYRSIAGRRYDLVLVIKGEVVPAWFLERLREDQPEAKFVFYSFDAIRNSSNCLELFPFFDRLFSFDFEDVQAYPRLELKHLFYTGEYAGGPPLDFRDYDLSFVGTLHSKRYQFVQKAFQGFESTFQFFYVQAPWFYYLSRLTSEAFRNVARQHVSFEKLGRIEVAKIFQESRAVLDMQREGQSGLTMRTFEVLASGATLITSNAFIKETEFYDPERVIVLPPGGAEYPDELVERVSALSRDGRPPAGFEKYCLDSWVADFIAVCRPELVEATVEDYR
jgi:hypothetical protein